jgi:2-succinyl-6-hydroxy-2,4-cyclohexadiene-1-carboxylate synthase
VAFWTATVVMKTIVIHGFMGDRHDVENLVEGATVWELPGHGDNQQTTSSWDELIDEWANRLPSSDVHLIGYSMGGRVTLGLYAKRRDAIARCTVVSAHPGLGDVTERAARLARDEQRATWLKESPDSFLTMWRELALWGPQRGDRWSNYNARAVHSADWADTLQVLSLGQQPDYRDSIAGIECIVGANDTTYVDVANALPDATVHVIEGAWHAVHRDAPEKVAALLR